MKAPAAAHAHGVTAALPARPAAACRQRPPQRSQASAAQQAAPGRCHALIAASAGSGAAVSTVEAAATVKVPTNLNTIPHARETRKWFYSDLTSAVMRALEAGETRVIARCVAAGARLRGAQHRLPALWSCAGAGLHRHKRCPYPPCPHKYPVLLHSLCRSTFPELNTEFDVYRIGTLVSNTGACQVRLFARYDCSRQHALG